MKIIFILKQNPSWSKISCIYPINIYPFEEKKKEMPEFCNLC
jgi:hypothetical protein